jgi:CAAX prenyl protease-like protein
MARLPKETDRSQQSPAAGFGLRALLDRHRWIVFVLPLAVYMLAGTLEPAPGSEGGKLLGFAVPYSAYPVLYTVKLGLTIATIALVLPGYRRFPFRISPLAVVVGAAGIVVWVGLAKLGVEWKLSERLLQPLGLVSAGQRPEFNPWEHFSQPGWMWAFLAVRLLGLAVVVPLIEEFFLRGFVMRFVVAQDWWDVPFGKVNAAAIAVSIVVPMLTHPGELLAAAAWFGLVTWLMVRTRNIWDCVAAHAVTNLLLGVYVLKFGQWWLW